jgi:hypothetical protein
MTIITQKVNGDFWSSIILSELLKQGKSLVGYVSRMGRSDIETKLCGETLKGGDHIEKPAEVERYLE